MRILHVGDVVGRSGREVVLERLPELRARLGADAVVVNGENAAGGFGITAKICEELYAAGADVITTGNHVWDQREIVPTIERDPRLLRPANLHPSAPGRGLALVETRGGQRLAVLQLMGRLFMGSNLDDPFRAVDELLKPFRLGGSCDAILVDVHAEATSEKMALGHYLDGRVSVVAGTHTHVPTADAQILPGGTAYISDLGMSGDYDSVIGMEKAMSLQRFTRALSSGRMGPALGPACLCALLVETGPDGLARAVAPLRLGARLAETFPEF